MTSEPLDSPSFTSEDYIMMMIHKRVRRNSGYNFDSNELHDAMVGYGYELSVDDVLMGLADLKEKRYIRSWEDRDDTDPVTGRRGTERVTRYWNIEITPEGAMHAINLQNMLRASH